MFKKIFISLIILAIVGIGGGLAFKNYIDHREYSDASTEKVVVTIPKGKGIAQIATLLKDKEVIASTKNFISIASGNTLSYGNFSLNKHITSEEALRQLLDKNNRVDIQITIPEGRTVYQTIGLISDATGLTRLELNKALFECADLVKNDLDKKSIIGFEGWLFPDTYSYEYGTKPVELFKTMIQKTVDELKNLNVSESNWQTVLTKASIVIRETSVVDDMPKIARVIENRLKINMVLGMDSTVAYGVTKGEYDHALELKQSDLDDENAPYNSRKKTGLPPSPIANPGLNAMKAVLNPADGSWIYFVTTDPTNLVTEFATTESEFNKLRDKYKEWVSKNKDKATTDK